MSACYQYTTCETCRFCSSGNCAWSLSGNYCDNSGALSNLDTNYCSGSFSCSNNNINENGGYNGGGGHQGTSTGGIISLIIFIIFILASIIVGYIENKKRTNQEGNDLSEKNEDPMNMDYDKRFPKSEECDCTRNINKKCYSIAKKGFFNLFSLLLGIFLAIGWGFTLGISEFFIVWFILPYIDIGKRFYLPVAKLIGDVLNAVYGKCFRNLKTVPAIFNFGNIKGNNKVLYKKIDDENNDNEKFDENSSIGDPFGLKFIIAFPKSDEIKEVRKLERLIYDICRIGSYNVLSAFPGIPLSLIWGLIYGIFAFLFMWIIIPVLKVVKMFYLPAAHVAGAIMNAIYGKCLRNLRSEPYSFNYDNNGNSDDDDVKDPELMQTPGITNGLTTDGQQTAIIVNNNQQMLQMASVPNDDEVDGDGAAPAVYPNINNAPMQTNAHIYK